MEKEDWSFVSMKEYFERVMKMHEDADVLRHEGDGIRLEDHEKLALSLYEGEQKRTDALFAALERSIAKTEAATDTRFHSVNELRGALSDQQRLNMPRTEADAHFTAIDVRVTKLEAQRLSALSEQAGTRTGYAWAVGVVAIIATIIAIMSAFIVKAGGGV